MASHSAPQELEALAQECAAIAATLEAVPASAWQEPALGEWSLAELVSHLIGGLDRIRTYLDEPVPDGPAIDPVTYFGYDPREASAGIAQRARERAARTAPSALPKDFRATWTAARDRALTEDAGRVMTTFRGPMRLSAYLQTRALEAVVHHIDIRTALGLDPAPTPEATRLTLTLLEGLLGAPMPAELEQTEFIRAATGRIPSNDARFPVLE